MDIKIKVIDAGSFPQCEWDDEEGCWQVPEAQQRDISMLPRILLEVSEEAARALAAHLGDEITITLPEPP